LENALDAIAELRAHVRKNAAESLLDGIDKELQACFDACRETFHTNGKLSNVYAELEDIYASLRRVENELAALLGDQPDESRLLSWAKSMHYFYGRRNELRNSIRALNAH
jgi:hypothetical protein